MDRRLLRNLVEAIVLTAVTFLVHSSTLYEAGVLYLLFVSVLVIIRGVREPDETEKLESSTMEPKGCRFQTVGSIGFQATKFYAVARGVTPGIYRSWEECAPMVIGVKGAIYKSFLTRDKAKSFLRSFS